MQQTDAPDCWARRYRLLKAKLLSGTLGIHEEYMNIYTYIHMSCTYVYIYIYILSFGGPNAKYVESCCMFIDAHAMGCVLIIPRPMSCVYTQTTVSRSICTHF